jgi:polar amino acid transport system permease protein
VSGREGPASARGALPGWSLIPRRRRRRIVLAVQYGLVAAVAVIVLVSANREQLSTHLFNVDIARQLFPEIITIGLRNTVLYTVLAYAFGLVLGLVIALMRLSSVLPYRWFAIAFVEIFRGLPALLIIIFIGVGLTFAFDIRVPGDVVGQITIALGLVAAGYMAETIRAGIQAVPRGQMEAARSLGMSYARAMWSIIIPQAFRIVIPPLTNELVLLFKDSSLVLFLAITLEQRDLTKFGRDLAGQQGNVTPIIVAGLCYLIITIPLGVLARRIEERQRTPATLSRPGAGRTA